MSETGKSILTRLRLISVNGLKGPQRFNKILEQVLDALDDEKLEVSELGQLGNALNAKFNAFLDSDNLHVRSDEGERLFVVDLDEINLRLSRRTRQECTSGTNNPTFIPERYQPYPPVRVRRGRLGYY